MRASRNWIKKKFWRSSSTTSRHSEVSDSFSYLLDDGYGRPVAAVVSTKVVVMPIEEWAAIRIQTNFRAFMAKRALRALKAIVRIQALFRGRLVRRGKESLVRGAQAQKPRQIDPTKRAEVGWCSSPGSAEEVKSRLQLRQVAALKRERAAAYAFTQQQRLTREKLSWFSKTSTSSNSSSISTTSGSNNTLAKGCGCDKPSYMTATASHKAKQRASPSRSVNNMERPFDNASFYYKSSPTWR